MNIKEICQDILDFIKQNDLKKRNAQEYSEKDVLQMLSACARAEMLCMFDHFSEIATSPKTSDLLLNKQTTDMSEKLERLLIIENNGNTDQLIKEAESLLQVHKGSEYDTMIRLVVRKHLLTNKSLTFSKRQQIVDKIFGKENRKILLLSKE